MTRRYLVTRNNPFVLRNSINDLFDDFFQFPKSETGALQNISLDVAEDENNYYLSADVTGVNEKDVDIELDKNLLTIKAVREHEHKDKKHHIQESYYGQLERSLTLPDNVDADNINASFKNGVLKIEIPKVTKTEHVKKITIQS